MRSFIFACVLVVIGCSLFNPRTDVVYVPPGDAVKLRENIKNVDVWIKTKEGEILPGKINLSEGWY